MEKSTVDMEAFRNGSEKVFKEVFDKYHRPLTIFAGRITNQCNEAEDIVVETFIKLAAKRADFALEINVKAFLYISVRNACMNQLKCQGRTSRRQQEYETFYRNRNAEGLEADTEDAELIEHIYKLLPTLPSKNLEIVKLFLEGKTYSEIARIQNTSVDNVIHHVFNAAKKLRNLLPLTLLYLIQ